MKEVKPIQPFRVRYGRFSIQLPGELALYLLAKIIAVLLIQMHL